MKFSILFFVFVFFFVVVNGMQYILQRPERLRQFIYFFSNLGRIRNPQFIKEMIR